MNPHLEMRNGKVAQIEVYSETRCSSLVGLGMSGNFLSCIKVSSTLSCFRRERGISLETLLWKRASSRVEGRISWFFSSSGGRLGVPLEL